MKKKPLFIFISFLLLTSVVLASSITKETETVEMNGAKRVVLKGELGAGEFNIISKNTSDAFKADISYSPKDFTYEVSSETKSDKCMIDLNCETRKNHDFDTDDNKWDMVLSDKYPYEINLDIGACESNFDFGNTPLDELILDIGAADAEILFSERNSVRCKEINIDAGASSLSMSAIGNANFESFSLNGGAGSFDLDFLGEYEGTSYIDIDVGLGSADIVLPKDVAIQIITDGDNWFSSVDIHNNRLDEVDDDTYESEDFEDAKDKIILKISVGMGSVDIRFRR